MTTPTPRPPDSVLPLCGGAANVLEGEAPDRVFRRVTRAELHRWRCGTAPRGRALVLAGGGYLQLVHDKEGAEVARWLNTLGLDADVLVHRLPGQPDGQGGVWPSDIARRDGLAALDLLAGDPALPLLLVGLSSGGHLAGVMACQDHAVIHRDGRGVLMAYAPLNANHRDHKAPPGKPDYPPPEKQAFYDAWPIGLAAHPHGLPRMPVFLAYALHDPIVPVAHALNLIQGVQQTGGDVEAHIFAQAEHGFALRALSRRRAAPRRLSTRSAGGAGTPAPGAQPVHGTHDQWPALAARWIHTRLDHTP